LKGAHWREAHNLCGEIKLRAERRIGDELKKVELASGQLRRGSQVEPRDDKPKLDDLGITKKQSHTWQMLADVPESEFNNHVASALPETATERM
jgi:hypothetical protein